MLPIHITARSVAGRLSRRLGGGRRRAVSHLGSRRGAAHTPLRLRPRLTPSGIASGAVPLVITAGNRSEMKDISWS